MLESAGYKVHTAVDGEEGLRMASAQDYRLILTDLEMPKVNGYEVIQGLRSRPQTQETPIIVMTTRAGEKHRQLALSVGASSYIAKPVEERALIQEVERLIGKEAAAR
jgi:chemosensory pili system protein ChpA (sensor histidine kinase/response regulator)